MRRLRTLLSILLTLAFSTTGFAQTYQGRILGTVTDENGAVVRGAHVTITNVETGLVRTLDTNESGGYVAPNLPPGLYNITVEAQSFKRVEHTQVRVEVAKDVDID